MSFNSIIEKIRTAIYGKEVRESIASALETLKEENVSIKKITETLLKTGKFEITDTLSWFTIPDENKILSNVFEFPGDSFIEVELPSGCSMEIVDEYGYVERIEIGDMSATKKQYIKKYVEGFTTCQIILNVSGGLIREEEILDIFKISISSNLVYEADLKYELIREDVLSEDISQYEVNQCHDGQAFKYKDIKIIIEKNSNGDLSIFSEIIGEKEHQFINGTSKPIYAGAPIIIKYSLDDSGFYYQDVYIACGNEGNKTTYNPSESKLEYCNCLKLSAKFKTNTKISVFGRRKVE